MEHLLVRDFVHRSLYGPQGYFEQRTVVGSAEAVLFTKPIQEESCFIEMVQYSLQCKDALVPNGSNAPCCFRSLYGPQGYFEQCTVVGSAQAVLFEPSLDALSLRSDVRSSINIFSLLFTKPNQKERSFIEMVQLCETTEVPHL